MCFLRAASALCDITKCQIAVLHFQKSGVSEGCRCGNLVLLLESCDQLIKTGVENLTGAVKKAEFLSFLFIFRMKGCQKKKSPSTFPLFQTKPSTSPQLFKASTLKCFSNLSELFVFYSFPSRSQSFFLADHRRLQ